MKAIFTLLAVAAVALVSCKDDNKGLLDPNAMISIRAAQGVPSGKADAPNPQHLTAREIVQKANSAGMTYSDGTSVVRSFWEADRDLEHNRLLIPATNVIESTGRLNLNILESSDWVLRIHDKDQRPTDTIAYVPNSVLRDVEMTVKTAYTAGDYAACYRTLDAGFRFTPITGAEWRALKAKNEN